MAEGHLSYNKCWAHVEEMGNYGTEVHIRYRVYVHVLVNISY